MFSSFPHRHGDAAGNPATRARHVDAEKPGFRTRLPPILIFSTRYQTGWNVTKCHACYAKRHDNLLGHIRIGEVRHGDATGKPATRDKTRGCRKTSILYETSGNFHSWQHDQRTGFAASPIDTAKPRDNQRETRDETRGSTETSISCETSSNFDIFDTLSNRLECHKVPRLPRKTTWQPAWTHSNRRCFPASPIDTATPPEIQRLEQDTWMQNETVKCNHNSQLSHLQFPQFSCWLSAPVICKGKCLSITTVSCFICNFHSLQFGCPCQSFVDQSGLLSVLCVTLLPWQQCLLCALLREPAEAPPLRPQVMVCQWCQGPQQPMGSSIPWWWWAKPCNRWWTRGTRWWTLQRQWFQLSHSRWCLTTMVKVNMGRSQSKSKMRLAVHQAVQDPETLHLSLLEHLLSLSQLCRLFQLFMSMMRNSGGPNGLPTPTFRGASLMWRTCLDSTWRSAWNMWIRDWSWPTPVSVHRLGSWHCCGSTPVLSHSSRCCRTYVACLRLFMTSIVLFFQLVCASQCQYTN